MDIFVSSVIQGMEAYRQAAVEAVEALGYRAVRAEDFGARTETPRRACLGAARDADLTLVLLGERYGEIQASGRSATHEEFEEARDHGSVAVFVQRDIAPGPSQRELIREAQSWSAGRFAGEFGGPGELRSKVSRVLHEHALSQARPADPGEILARARERLPGRAYQGESRLHLIVAGGPRGEVLAPARLEDEAFQREISKAALYGSHPIFDDSEGVKRRLVNGSLRLEQRSGWIEVGEDGTVSVALPAFRRDQLEWTGLPVLIEEDVQDALDAEIGFLGWLLDEADGLHRLSDILVIAALEGGSGFGWKTREEHRANPNQASISMRQQDLVVVPEHPVIRPRAALMAKRGEIVADLVVRLRREVRS